MLKTMKVKKNMSLDELIKYVWENGINNEYYYSDLGNHVSVGVQTLLWTNGVIGKNDTFTVEVEEEITEDTELVGFQEVFLDKELRELKVEIHAPLKRKSINDVLEEHYEETECLQIYAKVNGKLELIWEAE